MGSIRKDYPGGNIEVVGQNGDIIELAQEIRDTGEWWFYWNFCAEGFAGREITFRFTNGNVVGYWGPARSYDLKKWEFIHTVPGAVGHEFTYRFGAQEHRVYFSLSLPYQLSHYGDFCRKNEGRITAGTLGVSEKGRDIPYYDFGAKAGRDIVFTCRHHACESPAAYVLEGLAEYLLDDCADTLLRDYHFHVLPFMDVDGVEDGDQGKARLPHDHNRDYTAAPIYASTRTLMGRFPRIYMGIDLHAPWMHGGENDHPFIPKEAAYEARQGEFGRILAAVTAERPGGIVYDGAHDIEPNTSWNLSGTPTSESYFEKAGAVFSMTLETPYFGVGEAAYSQDSLREFGRCLGRALEVYITRELG